MYHTLYFKNKLRKIDRYRGYAYFLVHEDVLATTENIALWIFSEFDSIFDNATVYDNDMVLYYCRQGRLRVTMFVRNEYVTVRQLDVPLQFFELKNFDELLKYLRTVFT